MKRFLNIKRVLITGAEGFIGKNLVNFLEDFTPFDILPCLSSSSNSQLEQQIRESDFLIHLAGVNRPSDIREFESINYGFTKKIIDLLKKYQKDIPIIFSSSTQVKDNNAYGISKLKAESLILQYKKNQKSKAYILRLPGIFGKGCRANYNSVVATFCNNIANNLPIEIHDPNTVIILLYIDDLVEYIYSIITDLPDIDSPILLKPIYEISLQDLSDKLHLFHQNANSGQSFVLDKALDKALYSTYLSYTNNM